jgi:uncharacterized C2H2 Zn-finger protein
MEVEKCPECELNFKEHLKKNSRDMGKIERGICPICGIVFKEKKDGLTEEDRIRLSLRKGLKN